MLIHKFARWLLKERIRKLRNEKNEVLSYSTARIL